ncbi:MAG: hypothetical protein IPK12_06070 [Gemmatimonadetes bacterium]|nr:hypothetical protein [Gemmatimonadota bacterium]
MRSFGPVLLLAAATLPGACTPAARPSAGPSGTLTATWSGPDTLAGQLNAPARGGWCAGTGRLDVIATRDDQAVGLAIFPVDSLQPGEYAVFDPGIDTARRPAVAGAARWYTDAAIVGYQSDSGQFTLSRDAKGGLGAEFGFRLVDLTREDTIRLTGTMTGLVPGGCEDDSLPNPDRAD